MPSGDFDLFQKGLLVDFLYQAGMFLTLISLLTLVSRSYDPTTRWGKLSRLMFITAPVIYFGDLSETILITISNRNPLEIADGVAVAHALIMYLLFVTVGMLYLWLFANLVRFAAIQVKKLFRK